MIILFGAGIVGKMALEDYGKDKVAYFCDNYCRTNQIGDIPVIDFEELKRIHKDYDVIVTPWNTAVRQNISKQLSENEIPYSIYKPKENPLLPRNILHIHGVYPCLNYELGDTCYTLPRVYQTTEMFKRMFKKFYKDFEDHQISIYVYLLDSVDEAYEISKNNHWDNIFAYCTLYSVSDTVIPIPDFKSFINKEEYFYAESMSECKKAAERPWEDARVCRRGNIKAITSRNQLLYMNERFPQYFSFEAVNKGQKENYMSMTEQAKYKYLIDIRGTSWTDRVKVLFHLKRPIFLVDRPYKEWFFDALVAWKHFIPVKEDLSDLVQSYEYIEKNPQKYDEICENMQGFADKYLSPEAVLKYLRDICLEYGVNK